jgi:hypothetical protein
MDVRSEVARGLDAGLSQAEIARRLAVSNATVCRHAAVLGRPADPRFRRRHDWAEIQRFHDEGHSVRVVPEVPQPDGHVRRPQQGPPCRLTRGLRGVRCSS